MKRAVLLLIFLVFFVVKTVPQETNIDDSQYYYDNGLGWYWEKYHNDDQNPGEHGGTPSETDDDDGDDDDGDDDGGDDDGGDGGNDGGDDDGAGEAPFGASAKLGEMEGVTGYTAEQLAEIEALDQELLFLTKATDNLFSGKMASLPSMTMFESIINDKIKESVAKRIEEVQKKKSAIIGDPVYVVNGEFYDFNTDISIRYVKSTFDITRNYTSDSTTSGVFGKNQVSSLDSRLVFGVELFSDDECTEFYNTQVSPLKTDMDALINQYCSAFGKNPGEWQTIAPGINATLLELRDLKTLLTDRKYQAFLLEAGTRGTNIHSEAYVLWVRVGEQLEEAEKLLAEYEQFYPVASNIDELIRKYQTNYNDAKTYYEEMLEKKSLEEAITAINAPALTAGTKSWYRTSGFDTISLIDAEGACHTFSTKNINAQKGAVSSPVGTVWNCTEQGSAYSMITKTDEGFMLTLSNGSRQFFSKEGLLLSIADAYNNTITFTRDSNYRISTITTVSGSYTLSYDGQYISSISKAGGTKAESTYTYENGRLSSVTDVSGYTLRYVWKDGLLSGFLKSDGSTITLEYNAVDQDGRKLTTSTTNEEGFSEHFEYDPVERTTLHTDHAGVKTLYRYDENYRITETLYSDGTSVHYDYDSSGRKSMASYSNGSFESWLYDNDGNITAYTDTKGITYAYTRNKAGDITALSIDGIPVFSRHYRNDGLIYSETVYSEPSVTTVYTYDDEGNAVSAVSDGKTMEWTWDDEGFCTSYTVNHVRQYEKSKSGNVTQSITLSGLKTESTVNDRNDVTSVKETDIISGEMRISEYEYDKRHLMTALYKGNGNTRYLSARFAYDGEGRTRAIIMYHGNAATILRYIFEDARGILCASPRSAMLFNVSPENVSAFDLTSREGFESADLSLLATNAEECFVHTVTDEEAVLNSSEQTEEYTSPSGNADKRYDYSADRRTLTVTAGDLYKTTYTLNAWGEPVAITDGNGNTTHLTRDCSGNVISMTDPYGNMTVYSYDQSGNQIKTEFPDGSWEIFDYDVTGNLTKVTDGLGVKLQQRFDSNGNLVYKAGRGLVETRYQYDSENKISAMWEADIAVMTDGSESNNQASASGSSTVQDSSGLIRDEAGNITEALNGSSHMAYLYDSGGKLITQKNLVTGNETTFSYDKAGNRTLMQDGSRTVTYEYGLNNELTRMTEIRDGITVSTLCFGYDALGRQTECTYMNGITETTSYDEGGNILFCTGRNKDGALIWGEGYVYDEYGRISACIRSDASLSLYSYDSRNRLISVLETDTDASSSATVESVYLSSGMYQSLQSLLNSMQTTLGNALSVLQSMKRTEYAYDVHSNRISMTTSKGTTYFDYDDQNRLIRSGNTVFSYDEDGNLISEISDTKTIMYEYSDDDRLLSSTVTDLSEGRSYTQNYQYDSFGRRICTSTYELNTDGTWTLSGMNQVEFDGFSLNPSSENIWN